MLELYLDAREDLGYPEEVILIEHSLVSLSAWEAKWEKPFFNPREERTPSEMESYMEMMVVGARPQGDLIKRLRPEQLESVGLYLNSKQTATWFRETAPNKGGGELITSEIIYYWMIEFKIPFTCETWHLNRLLTLVKVCSNKQAPPKKMSKRSVADQYRSLNAQRRNSLGTTG